MRRAVLLQMCSLGTRVRFAKIARGNCSTCPDDRLCVDSGKTHPQVAHSHRGNLFDSHEAPNLFVEYSE